MPILTITLPGQDMPSMQLFTNDMVLAPGANERNDVMTILIEALAILVPPNPRRSDEKQAPKLRVIKDETV